MRIVKHWKQVFKPGVPFIFTRGTRLEEGFALVGSTVPDYLADDAHRMKMWWRANRIALKNWDYLKGQPMTDDEVSVRDVPLYKELGGAWFLFQDGTKAHGKKQLEAKLATLS